MSERSGAGLVGLAILEALDSLGARSGRRPVKNERVLSAVEQRIGLAPGYAYEVLLDLARWWTVPVRLVACRGNYGGRGNDPPANFRYTEAALSPVGEVALAAERGELAPVPIGLINGNAHRGGTRPSFRPESVVEAVRQVVLRPRVTGRELVGLAGPPDFLTGCAVTGDLAALAAGRPAELRLQATVSIGSDHRSVVIENVPPQVNCDDLAIALASRARGRDWRRGHPGLDEAARLPLADLRDESRHDGDRLVCVPERGTTAEALRGRLMDVYGISVTVRAALPQALPTMIRRWVRAWPGENLLASLAALESAARAQPARG